MPLRVRAPLVLGEPVDDGEGDAVAGAVSESDGLDDGE